MRLVVDGATASALELVADPRSWLPGSSTALTASLSGLAEGTHTLALWLPDAEPALGSDPRFSVRLANDGTWDAVGGLNELGSFEVPAAP